MTRYDAIRRQLGDIEKAHERALAKRDMQIRLLCGYRDELEDEVDIAAGMIVDAYYRSKDKELAIVARDKDDALALIAGEHELRQAARDARKVAAT